MTSLDTLLAIEKPETREGGNAVASLLRHADIMPELLRLGRSPETQETIVRVIGILQSARQAMFEEIGLLLYIIKQTPELRPPSGPSQD